MPNPVNENIPETLDIVIVAQWDPDAHVDIRDFPEDLRHVLANPKAEYISLDDKAAGIAKQLMKYGRSKKHIWKITYRPEGQQHKEIIILRLADKEDPRKSGHLTGIVTQARLVGRRRQGKPAFKVALEFDGEVTQYWYQVDV